MMGSYDVQYKDFAYYYDILMQDVDYSKWSDYILDIIDKNSVTYMDMLEMACGTGNIAVNMAKKGYSVTAFDISEDMLSIAYDKALQKGVKINFLVQDMRDSSIHNKFGIVLCLCDSINYITDENDLLNTFKWVYNHLKDTGLFIFDINSSYKLKNIIGNNTFTYNEDDLVYIWDNTITERGVVEFYLTFFVKHNGLYRRFDEFHEQKIYDVEDIVKLLRAAGFSDICINDAFTFNDVAVTSERINFTAKK